MSVFKCLKQNESLYSLIIGYNLLYTNELLFEDILKYNHTLIELN